MSSPDRERYSNWESLTTILWLLLDASWLFEWRWVALVAAVAAVLAAAMTLVYAERDASSFCVALGLFGWVLMNAAWVTGDLNSLPWAVTLAKVLTGLIAVCLIAAVLAARPARIAFSEVLGKFRKLRF